MQIKVKKLQAIKISLKWLLLVTVVSCGNDHSGSVEDSSLKQKKDDNTLSATKEKIPIVNDTLIIGRIHVVEERGDFFQQLKANHDNFFYSDIEKRDFFLINDTSSKNYFLLGAENGVACLVLGLWILFQKIF